MSSSELDVSSVVQREIQQKTALPTPSKPLLPQAYTNRYEIKYLVPARKMPQVRGVLGELLVPDTNNGSHRGYYNHSIYFDSPDYRYYTEKNEGNLERTKPRLRFYRPTINSVPAAISLELKGRYDRIVTKRRSFIDADIAESLLNDADPAAALAGSIDDVSNEFCYLAHRFNLQPCVTVLYHREAFFSDIYKSVRVTYDSGLLCSLSTSSSNPVDSYLDTLPTGDVVVEVKYNDQIPKILLSRLQYLGIQQRTFSKFATSLERSIEQVRSRHFRSRRSL